MTVVKLQKKFDMEVCLKAEKFIKDSTISFDELKQIFELKDKIGFITIKKMMNLYTDWVFYQFDDNIQPKEGCKNELENYRAQIMLDHYALSLITDRTLLFPEFKVRYESNRHLDEMLLKQVWEHNKHCEIFFINTYKEIVKAIDIITVEQEQTSMMILYASRWIFRMIKIIDTYRNNFRYCTGCQYNIGMDKRCRFWDKVMSDIFSYTKKVSKNGRRLFKDLDILKSQINSYFKQLSNVCKISDGVREMDLKQKEIGLENYSTNIQI